MNEEFYPMPLFVRMTVRDVEGSARWYMDALGFRSVYAMPGANGKQQMNHLRLGRYQDLMLVASPQGAQSPAAHNGFVIYINYFEDIEELARRVASYGAEVEGPTETLWNTREVNVTDPDGFHLAFSQVVNINRKFSDVMPPSVS